MSDKIESAQALQVKIVEIMEHGDPAMQEMLRDLIFEFHSQVMADPKSRAGMKSKLKGLRALGNKVVNLPLVFIPDKREPGEKSRYWKSAIAIAVILLAFFFIPPSKVVIKNSFPPVRVCNIKGNINEAGEKIYHVPNSKWYERTFIDVSRGERWFCSEDEARGAGWRSPYSN